MNYAGLDNHWFDVVTRCVREGGGLMATVVIGDIHGNYRALDDLLSKVQAGLQAEDTVVFLGDYVERVAGADR